MRIRSTSILLVFAFRLVFSSGLYAQTLRESPSVRIEHIAAKSLAITQDHQGFMWFGGFDGLYRYDGYTLKHYRPDPQDSTALGGHVEALYVDRSGTLWVGVSTGLDRYDPATDSFTRFRHDSTDVNSMSKAGAGTILEDRTGAFWVGTFVDGLHRMDRATGKFTHFRHDPVDTTSLACNGVQVIYEDHQGTLWVGTGIPFDPKMPPESCGLNRFNPETGTFTRFKNIPGDVTSLLNNNVSALIEDTQGTFWVGTWGDGLHTMDRERGTFIRHRYDPNDPLKLSRPFALGTPREMLDCWLDMQCGGVKFIHEDRSGILWIGAFGGGINRYDPSTGVLTHIEAASSDLEENTIWSMFESHDGTLWIGTWDGAYRLVPTLSSFRHYVFETADPNNRAGAVARNILEDHAGVLWIGTWGDGLYRWDRSTGASTHFRPDPNDPGGLRYGVILSLFEDREGFVWVGMEGDGGGGLARFDRTTNAFTYYQHDPADSTSLPFPSVDVIFEDRQGQFWIGAYSFNDRPGAPWPVRLARFDRASGHFSAPPAQNIGISIIQEDREGILWIGTWGAGLNRYDLTMDSVTTFLPGRVIFSVDMDDRDRLWTGTQDGVYKLNPNDGTSTRYGIEEGLPDFRVQALVQDDEGYVWITSRGFSATWLPDHGNLSCLDPRTGTVTYFDEVDGLPDIGFVIGSVLKSRDGTLFFGGNKGIVAFNPGQVSRAIRSQSKVALTSLRVFNDEIKPGQEAPIKQSIPVAKEIRLNHKQNDFTIDYVMLSYRDPASVRYSYRLENHDADWVQARTQRSARYSGVSPGRYTFRVRGVDSKGNLSEETSIAVVIIPPWWRRLWAYIIYGVLFGVGVFFVDRTQRRRLIRKERERARERELEQKHEIEAANTRLRAQEQILRQQNTLLETQKAELGAGKLQIEEQARRLAELDQIKSRFFANISHEFRTPLTLILGPLHDALSGRYGALDEKLGAQLSLMQHNGERLLELIGQLLDLSRLEAGSMHLQARRANLVPLLQQIVLAFSARAEREDITLQYSIHQDTIELYFDRDKLEKILVNLLSNAFKFTPSGGKIHLRAATTTWNEREVVEIVVRDTGEGIPEADLPYIFDRFYQADTSATRRHEGSGIGLALVKELVELHHGAISVESIVGFGTTFTVRLLLGKDHLQSEDLADAAEAGVEIGSGETVAWMELHEAPEPVVNEVVRESEPEQAAPSHTEKSAHRPVVLVVEDNASVRIYLRDHLSERYEVFEAANGVEGLEWARTHPPDLVISDIMMPVMDGYELCRALKNDLALNHIPVILLTAKAGDESKLEGLGTGADDYLTKPFSADELLLRAENLIEMRRVLRRRFSEELVLGPSELIVSSQEAVFLEQVRTIVEAHLGDSNFGVDRLAEEVGLSTRQLHRKIQDAIALTPAGYIRMMRLQRAAQLLRQGAGNVSEVAYAVGFQNATYFSNLFKQTFGVVPSEFTTRAEKQ